MPFCERGSHVSALHTTGYYLQCPVSHCRPKYSYTGSYAHVLTAIDVHLRVCSLIVCGLICTYSPPPTFQENHWGRGAQGVMSYEEKNSYETEKKRLAERLRVDVKKCFPIDMAAMNAGVMFINEEDSAMPQGKRTKMG